VSRSVPDVAGIYAALGMRDAARTARTARAMIDGRDYVLVAFPAPRRHLNGRPVARRRPERTGRDWRTQPRAEGGRWASYETMEGAA
jgi:hypothetical protein